MATALARRDENELYIEDERDKIDAEPKIEESFNSQVYDSSNFIRREAKIEESFNSPIYDSGTFIRSEPKVQESFNSPVYYSSNFIRREPKIQERYTSPVYESSNFISLDFDNNKIQKFVPPLAYTTQPYGFASYGYYRPYRPYRPSPYFRPFSSVYGAIHEPFPAFMRRFTYRSYEREPYNDFGIPNYYTSQFGYSLVSIRKSLDGASSAVAFVPPVPPNGLPAAGMSAPLPSVISAFHTPSLFAGMTPPRSPTISAVPAPLSRFTNDISFAGSITSGAWTPTGTNKGGQMDNIRKPF